jgi:hypothetical protein
MEVYKAICEEIIKSGKKPEEIKNKVVKILKDKNADDWYLELLKTDTELYNPMEKKNYNLSLMSIVLSFLAAIASIASLCLSGGTQRTLLGIFVAAMLVILIVDVVTLWLNCKETKDSEYRAYILTAINEIRNNPELPTGAEETSKPAEEATENV